MLKKFASLLFEEEEVTEESPAEEKVDLRRVKKHDEPVIAVKAQSVSQPEIVERPKKSSFENIVVDDPAPQADPDFKSVMPEDRNEPVRPSEPTFIDRRPDYSKEVYEFKPVISPMFGIAESEKEHVRPTFVQTAEVKNDSHLQTVISPYYGAIHKDKKQGPEHPDPIVIEPTTPVKAKVAEYVEEAKAPVIENIALEDLIKPSLIPVTLNPIVTEENPNLEEKAEDVTQFSLFGED